MGAETARQNAADNMGYAQIEACEGCPLVISGSNRGSMRLQGVGRSLLQFNREEFVGECPQELPDGLVDEERFEACRERMVDQIRNLRLVKKTMVAARLSRYKA